MVHTFCPLSYTSQGIFLPIVGLFGLFHVLFVSALGAYRLVPIGTKLLSQGPTNFSESFWFLVSRSGPTLWEFTLFFIVPCLFLRYPYLHLRQVVPMSFHRADVFNFHYPHT